MGKEVQVAWITMDQKVTKTVTCRMCTPVNLVKNVRVANTSASIVHLDKGEPASKHCKKLLKTFPKTKNVATCWATRKVKCMRTCALAGPPKDRDKYCDAVKNIKKSKYTCGSFFLPSPHGDQVLLNVE